MLFNKVYFSVLLTATLFSCIRNPYTPDRHKGIDVVINEFMSSNNTSTLDEYGEPDDWIELFNAGTKPLNLHGLFLSDDSIKPLKFGLPDTTIQPGGFLVIWADNQTTQGRNHAPFKLSSFDGEEIILSLINKVIVDRVQFFPESGNPDARIPGISYGRQSDGHYTWGPQIAPSPGASNKGFR